MGKEILEQLSDLQGKDRYPYPIGYQAIRNHVGHIYKMEIQEGHKGPIFVVISDEGILCPGETPTIAWEKIQKTKNLRSQKRQRNLYARVDGAEIFGFTNPLVQRLFRELVANEHETAKQSDSSVGQPPPVTTEGSIRKKRSKLVKRKAVGTVCLDSSESDKDCSASPVVLQYGESPAKVDIRGDIGSYVPDTMDVLEERKPLNSLHISKDTKSTCNGIIINNKDSAFAPFFSDSPCNLGEIWSSNVEHGETTEACRNPEVNANNQSAAFNFGKGTLEGCELVSNCTEPSTAKDECQADFMPAASARGLKEVLEELKDGDGLEKDGKTNQVNFSTSTIPLEANSKFSLKDPILPQELNLSPSQQITQYSATQSSDGSFDKVDSDSMGQELARSMMTVLLPQVLPLLKKSNKKGKKSKGDEQGHVSSFATYTCNIKSVDEQHPVEMKAEMLSSGMHVVSDLKNYGGAHVDSDLAFGRTTADWRLGKESEVLCAKASIKENTDGTSCIHGGGEKTMLSDAVVSYTYVELENPVINVPQVSKFGDTAFGEASIEQKLLEPTSCQTRDKVNENHGELFKVTSTTEEKHGKQVECSVHPFIVQIKELEKHPLKPLLRISQGLGIVGALGSNCNVASGRCDDKFAFPTQHDKKDDLGTAKHDSALVECVVPDSFEDDPSANDNFKRTSHDIGELQASHENHTLSVANAEKDPDALGLPSISLETVNSVQQFGCSSDKMGIDLKSAVLCSGESDVKASLMIVNPLACKAIGGICVSDAITKRISTQDAQLDEITCEKIGKYKCTSDFDETHEKGDQFDGTQHAYISQREQISKCEFTGQGFGTLAQKESIQDEKSYNLGSECKPGQAGDVQAHFYSGGAQSWIAGMSGTGNCQKQQNDVYSIKQQQVKELSCDLQVTSAGVNMCTPCCQNTNNRACDHFSFDKNYTTEESHVNSYWQFSDKEVCHGVCTSWADDDLDVSRLILEGRENFKFSDKTQDISKGASQNKQIQSSDKFSGIEHVAFPSVSNLDLDSHVTMNVANHQRVDYSANARTEMTNLNSYQDVKFASCYQSIRAESFCKDSRGIQSVFTFSDVPPSTLMCKTVANNNCSEIISSQNAKLSTHQSSNANNKALQSVELVGCYEHPCPVISMTLHVHGEDIHLCVVCGFPERSERNIFIYKVVIGETLDNTSYLVGYTVAVLPDVKDYFDKKYTLDRYGIQLTPDGQNLILLQCIRVPDLREPQINCVRSQCTSQGQCGGHGVKLVTIQNGQVSVLTRLSSTESMYCILVSAPRSIIAAGENGSVHVWNMDLRWSMCLEEFILPSAGQISSICELLAVPCLSHLLIGRDCSGYYIIWDVTRRLVVSKFQCVDYGIFQSIVLGIVCRNEHDNISGHSIDCEFIDKIDSRKNLKENMASRKEGESWIKENNFPCSNLNFSEANIAVCLLVLAAPYKDQSQRNQDEYNDESKQRGLWRLAKLENNVLVVGSILDARASAAAMLSQTGVIGTYEGYIYMWEAMTGRKIFTSRDFEGVGISCISTNPMSSAFAVAGSDHRVLLYVKVLGSSTSCLLGKK